MHPSGRQGEREAFCVFEYIYFARPDSRMNGQVLQAARGRMGEILAREAPAPGADLVIAVPDSGNPAARGFARAAGLPQDDGLIKNRYVARTFIQPGQELRKHGLRMKFNPLPEIVGGKRLVVVDDSIVRGNTTRQIVQMLRDAGAREVHMRISAPPIRHPCFYGIDMSKREEMIAHERTPSRSRPSWASTRWPTCRWRASTRRSGATAAGTATPASRASTRCRAPRPARPRTRFELPLVSGRPLARAMDARDVLALQRPAHRAFYRLFDGASAGARSTSATDGLLVCVCPARPERSLRQRGPLRRRGRAGRGAPGAGRPYAGAGVEAWTVWVHPATRRSPRRAPPMATSWTRRRS